MNRPFLYSLLLALSTSLAARAGDAPPATPIAQDDAGGAAYGSGWPDASNGGSGFGAWKELAAASGSESHAGFYIATPANNADLKGAAKNGKAFGMYANGTGYEIASAARAFGAALAPGQSLAVTWQIGPYEKKFATDSDVMAAAGLTLRTGNEANGVDDYNKGSRFEFGTYTGAPNYQIYDGEENRDSGIPFSDGGVKLKFTLVTADTYNLEVTTLADGKTQTLNGRKLSGTAGGTLDSFCIFDRNWEKNDAYFNDFEVLPAGAASPGASPAAAGSPGL